MNKETNEGAVKGLGVRAEGGPGVPISPDDAFREGCSKPILLSSVLACGSQGVVARPGGTAVST